jgi:hypothetical protein
MAPALKNEISQFRELARHFFSRFFDNDLGVAILERRTTIYKISSLGSFDLFATVT